MQLHTYCAGSRAAHPGGGNQQPARTPLADGSAGFLRAPSVSSRADAVLPEPTWRRGSAAP